MVHTCFHCVSRLNMIIKIALSDLIDSRLVLVMQDTFLALLNFVVDVAMFPDLKMCFREKKLWPKLQKEDLINDSLTVIRTGFYR